MVQETIKGTWSPSACADKMVAVHGADVSKKGADFMAKINPNKEVAAFWREVSRCLEAAVAH